jgi:sigma-B regulation protein RsbU (phosphoserine phosphatase)
MNQLEQEIAHLKAVVEELSVLNELAIAASSALETRKILDIIVEKSLQAVKAEQGSILLVTERSDKPLQTLIRQDDRSSLPSTYKVGLHITGWVLKNRQPLLVANLASDNRFHTSEQEKKDIRTLLSVPIQFQGQLIGLLTVTNKKDQPSFNQEDLRLLSIIAAQSGQIIRNSQLQQDALEKERLAMEMATARQIQQALLPATIPDLPDLEIACYFNPAEEVGGDYFDFFPLTENQLGIVQADVSGHGASAAMIMTMLKGILYSITKNFLDLPTALSQINQVVHHTAPPETFITMLMLVYDSNDHTLSFSNAGHNPPLLYQKNTNTLHYLELRGCALNCLQDASYTMRKISLQPDDFILIYTDGLTEAVNQNLEMFGHDRLKNILSESRYSSANEIIEQVKRELTAFCGQIHQADDIALLVLKGKRINDKG